MFLELHKSHKVFCIAATQQRLGGGGAGGMGCWFGYQILQMDFVRDV